MATVLVIGAGIGGPVIAIHLQNNGYKPILFDKIREAGDVGGTLMLAPNGYNALKRVGLDKTIIDNACKVNQYINKKDDGSLLSSTNLIAKAEENWGNPLAGVKRTTIQRLLLDSVKEKGIPMHFGKTLEKIEDDPQKDAVVAHFSDGSKYEGAFIIGSDGLHSVTRTILFGKERPNYTGLTQTIGLAPRPEGYEDAFYNIYGVNSFFVSYPYSQTHVAFAATNNEPETPESWRGLSDEQIEQFKTNSIYTTWAEPVKSLLSSAERIIKVGLYDRPALEHWFKGRCVLIGDAAHPTSPHLGQGANQALEDCMYLVKALKAHSTISEPTSESLQAAFSAYETLRIPRTSKLVAAARAQGQMRVCEGEDACVVRNEAVKSMYGDLVAFCTKLDELFQVDF